MATPALPRTVALYLTALACSERKVSTIERALVAICQAHRLHGLPSPRGAAEVTEVLQGIRRTIGVAPKQKNPVLIDVLRALVEPLRKDDPGDTRDRALLCLGFASGCRRSELVALDVEDLKLSDDGLEAKAGKSERSIMTHTGHRSVSVVRATSGMPSSSTTTPLPALGSEGRR